LKNHARTDEREQERPHELGAKMLTDFGTDPPFATD
jgi:hypothetical protein